jgi:hypothetical protein
VGYRQRPSNDKAEIASSRAGNGRRRTDRVKHLQNLTRIYCLILKRLLQFVEAF